MQVVLALPGSNCPYLREDDVVSLSRGFQVRPDSLRDILLSIDHSLHGPAATIIGYLQGGITFRALEAHSFALHISDEALTELLGYLNTIGALQRSRGRLSTVQAYFEHIVVFVRSGIQYPGLTWRRNFSILALLKGVIRSSAVVVMATIVLGLVFSFGLQVPPDTLWITLGYGLLLLVGSTFVHEYAHYVFIARAGGTAAIIRRGMRLGLIHRTTLLTPRAEIYTALAGPLAGFCLSLSLMVIAFMLPLPWLAVAASCISLIHLCSLLPGYGDGKSIKDALRRKEAS